MAFAPLLQPILNDSAYGYKDQKISSNVHSINTEVSNLKVSDKKRMYNELTIGSITGMFLGIIIGKFSSLIVTLTLSVYLLLQFLQSRNLISIPWNYIFKFNSQSFDLKQLVFENFNFKLSFISSFLIACYNI